MDKTIIGENRGYRNLEIYRLAHELGIHIHDFSLKLPQYELYETGSQLRRASKSVSANIVEGYGRRKYKAEFIRFIVYSIASCDEATEWLTYVKDCHPNLTNDAVKLLDNIDKLGKKINKFLQSLTSNQQPVTSSDQHD
ncbi:MAG: four helix bundle protein [Thermodesulfobacteriota bacterium]